MRGPLTLLRDSWNLFTGNWKLFLGIFLVPGLITAYFDYLTATDTKAELFMSTNTPGFVLLLALMIISLIFMSLALYKAIAEPDSTTITSAYKFAVRFVIPYVALSLLTGILVLLGSIALIIPGIIIGVWLSFSYFILLFENKGVIESMKASREYVRGKWWGVFGRFLALGIFMIVVSIAIGLIGYAVSMSLASDIVIAVVSFVTSALAMPLAMSYTYLMYRDLRNSATIETIIEADIPPSPVDATI